MTTDSAGDKSFRIHKLVNGAIIVLALLTVLEDEALTEWNAMATIVLTLVATGAADAFSRALGDELAHRRRLTRKEAVKLVRGSALVLAPAAIPALFFAIASAGWLSLTQAFSLACWLLVFLLGAAGYLACAVCEGRTWRGLFYGIVIGALGLGIVALRLAAH
jgi:uncharacterized membrane protein YeaQ/YmgE (transglycosylase-associated protein family)